MIKIWVRPKGDLLVPVSRYYAEEIAALTNREYRARLTRGRSTPQNSKYWASLNRVVRGTALGDRYPTKDHLHRALLISAGYVAEIYTLKGERHLIPDSTAFDAMGADEFGKYMDHAGELLARETGRDPFKADGVS